MDTSEVQKQNYIEALSNNAQLVDMFKKICFHKISEILDHRRVKSMLIGMEILTIEDDYDTVTNNKPLMEALKQLLMMNSATTIEHSINPTLFTKSKQMSEVKYVTDFDILLRFESQDQFKSFNASRGLTNPESRLSDEELRHYWVNIRRNLKTQFVELRNTMVFNFGLDGRFNLNEKPPKQLRSPEEVSYNYDLESLI